MTDHEKRIREALEAGPVQYACHVDDAVDKSCALDPGQNLYDCVIATRLSAKGLCKTDCAEWKPINAPKSTVEVSAANLRALLADLDAVRVNAQRWLIARDLLAVEDIERAAKERVAYGLGTDERESLKADAAIDAALKGASHE